MVSSYKLFEFLLNPLHIDLVVIVASILGEIIAEEYSGIVKTFHFEENSTELDKRTNNLHKFLARKVTVITKTNISGEKTLEK